MYATYAGLHDRVVIFLGIAFQGLLLFVNAMTQLTSPQDYSHCAGVASVTVSCPIVAKQLVPHPRCP